MRLTKKGTFCVTLDSKILMYAKYTAVFSSSQALKFLLFSHPPLRYRSRISFCDRAPGEGEAKRVTPLEKGLRSKSSGDWDKVS